METNDWSRTYIALLLVSLFVASATGSCAAWCTATLGHVAKETEQRDLPEFADFFMRLGICGAILATAAPMSAMLMLALKRRRFFSVAGVSFLLIATVTYHSFAIFASQLLYWRVMYRLTP